MVGNIIGGGCLMSTQQDAKGNLQVILTSHAAWLASVSQLAFAFLFSIAMSGGVKDGGGVEAVDLWKNLDKMNKV